MKARFEKSKVSNSYPSIQHTVINDNIFFLKTAQFLPFPRSVRANESVIIIYHDNSHGNDDIINTEIYNW